MDQLHIGSDFDSGSHAETILDGSGNVTLNRMETFNIINLPQYQEIMAFWSFDNTWIDEISGNTITPSNGSAFSVDAKSGSHSAYFDGIDDYAMTDTLNFTTNDKLTISFWYKPFLPAQANLHSILESDGYPAADKFQIYQNTDSVFSCTNSLTAVIRNDIPNLNQRCGDLNGAKAVIHIIVKTYSL